MSPAFSIASPAPVVADRQRWTSESLLASGEWRQSLPAAVAAEFVSYCRRFPAVALDLAGFELDREELPELARWGDAIRYDLEHHAGLCWVEGLAGWRLTAPQQRLFYLAFGCVLGRPMTQYGRMYAVRDRGESHTEKAIPVSMTNACTGYHTDSSARDVVPDFVGLLCERPSEFGGESLVSNALMVRDAMARENPELLYYLEQPMIRDLVTPGTERNVRNLRANAFPVFQSEARAGGLLFRYMRYWIERGQHNAGQPLIAGQLAALDTLDRRLAAPGNVASFKLAAGDILWLNNRTLAHNRSAFHNTAATERVLQRMWVASGTDDGQG